MSDGGGGEEDGRKDRRMRAGCQPTKLEPHTEMWGTIKKNPCDYKGHTHTRLPEGRRKAKVKANVHGCTRKRQKNEDMTGGRDGTKVRVVVMKGEPSAQGHPMKPTSL